jgi:hypothetical protein
VGGGAGRETGVHPGQAPWCDTVLIPVSRHLSSGTGVHLITVNTFVHFGDPLTHLLPPVPRHWVVLLLWWQLQLLYYNYIHTLELVIDPCISHEQNTPCCLFIIEE